ncbi:hypothetical protein ABQE16_00860 [Enterococcus avium]|uniref:hypothetical protein n=1 Tax=Enterococcus avium TaxID=33945 RepID=UPI00288E1EA9|nr:hypothetical protein [Enterococcus avium]MDT2490602.1 hypothetical protein [Enterococcus avium]
MVQSQNYKNLNKWTVSKILYCSLIISMYSFFGCINLSDEYKKIFLFIISFLLFLFKPNKTEREKKFFFKHTNFYISIMCISAYVTSIYRLGPTFNAFGKLLVAIAILLIGKSVQQILLKDGLFSIKWMLQISLIANIITLVQSIVFNYFNIIFLNIDYSFRDGRIRFALGNDMVPVIILFSFSLLIRKNKKFNKLALANFISGIVVIVYSSQTRQILVGVIIGILATIMIDPYIRKNAFKTYLVLLAFLALYLSGVYHSLEKLLITFFDTTGSYAGSNSIRLQEIKWYSETVIPKTFPFGIGIFDDVPMSEVYYLSRGPFSSYTTTDVGTLGDLVNFGIFAVFSLFSTVISFLKLVIHDYFFIGIVAYFCYAQFTTLSFFVLSNSMDRFVLLIFLFGLTSGLVYRKIND